MCSLFKAFLRVGMKGPLRLCLIWTGYLPSAIKKKNCKGPREVLVALSIHQRFNHNLFSLILQPALAVQKKKKQLESCNSFW